MWLAAKSPSQVYSTFVSLSGPPVVGDVFSTGGTKVFSTGGTKDEVVPAPRLPKEGVLMSDAL